MSNLRKEFDDFVSKDKRNSIIVLIINLALILSVLCIAFFTVSNFIHL